MKKGDKIYTPRFCTVTVEEVFSNIADAHSQGYTEPTYWKNDEWECFGKSIDMYHMRFAVAKKMR